MEKAKKNNAGKSKTWEKFEKLIAEFEELLKPKGAIVTHNAKIVDKDTGRPRQVDCTIQYKIGPTPILIAIECRRRSSPEDVRWIEELIQKKNSIRADVVVGVSSKGFSRQALSKAKALGVQLRSINTINANDIIQALKWQLHFNYYEVAELNLVFDASMSEAARSYLDFQLKVQTETSKKDLRIIRHEQIPSLLTPREVFALFLPELQKSNKLNQHIGQQSKTGSEQITIKLQFGKKWSIPFQNERIDFLEMEVRFALHESTNDLIAQSDPMAYLDSDGKWLAAIRPYSIKDDNQIFKDVSISFDPAKSGIVIQANLHDGTRLSSSNKSDSLAIESVFGQYAKVATNRKP